MAVIDTGAAQPVPRPRPGGAPPPLRSPPAGLERPPGVPQTLSRLALQQG